MLREVFVSDISGEEIANGSAAKITIQLGSAPSKVYVLDAREDEVKDLLDKAHVQNKRGRKPKTK